MSTLRFAAKAKTIVTSPTSNYVTEGSEEDLKNQVSTLLRKIDSLKKEPPVICRCKTISNEDIKIVLRSLPSISTDTAEQICKLLTGCKVAHSECMPIKLDSSQEIFSSKQEKHGIYINKINQMQKEREKDLLIIEAQKLRIEQLEAQAEDLLRKNMEMRAQDHAHAEKKENILTKKAIDSKNKSISVKVEFPNTTALAEEIKPKISSREVLRKALNSRKESSNSLKPAEAALNGNSSNRAKNQYFLMPKTNTLTSQLVKTDSDRRLDSSRLLRKRDQLAEVVRPKALVTHGSKSFSGSKPEAPPVMMEKDPTLSLLRQINKLQKENEDLRTAGNQGGQFEVFKLRAENIKMKEVINTIAGHDVSGVLFKSKSKSFLGESELLSSRTLLNKQS